MPTKKKTKNTSANNSYLAQEIDTLIFQRKVNFFRPKFLLHYVPQKLQMMPIRCAK